MGALKELTVEAFVGNLIQEKYINETETEKVTKMLENVRDRLSDKEKDFFLKTLIAQIDAPNSGLITQNRLNFANFENAIQEVGKVAEKRTKDRLERESKNQKNNGDNENLKEELLEKERKELEKEERIKENEGFIDDFFKDFLGLKDEEITAEEKREMAENLYKAEELDSLAKKYQDEGKSPEEAQILAMKDLGITEKDLEAPEMRLAQIQVLGKKISQLVKQGHSEEEAGKIVLAEDSVSVRVTKREIEAVGLKESVDALRIIALGTRKKIKEKRVDNRENKVTGVKVGDKLDVAHLMRKIEKREEMKESLRKIDRRMKEIEGEKDDDSSKKSNDLYKKMTDEYLLTGKSISSIFEKYKKKGMLGDLEFGDVFDGIIAEITPNITERYDTSYIIKLKEHENRCRIEELTLQEYVEAQLQGNLVKNSITRNKNPKIIAEMKKDQEKRAEQLKDFKKHLITKRNLNPNKKFWDPSELLEEPEEIGVVKPKEESLEQVLNNRDNVNRDRNAIIKLSKEQKISSNEAARQYFSENQEALKSYTKEEREALIGNQENAKKSVKGNRVLQQINTALIDRNYKSMERIAAELDNLRREVEKAEERGETSERVVGIKLKIQRLEKKFQKIEDNNKKLEKPKNVKTAEEILDKKVTDLDGKAIFRRYITTGKSAVEIYQEYAASRKQITFDEVLKSIEKEFKGYLNNKEIRQIIDIEKGAFQDMTKLELWKEQRGAAEKKNDSSEITLCQSKIDEIQTSFNERNRTRKLFKDLLIKRTGIKKDKGIETGKIDEGSEKLTENNQVEYPKLEIAEIETTPGIIPNVSAIAQKRNVTRSTVKSVFSKIFRLKQEKGSVSKEESKNNGNKTDTAVDQEVVQ